MPTPIPGGDTELAEEGERPSWWRRLVAWAARQAARGTRAIERRREERRSAALSNARGRRRRRRG